MALASEYPDVPIMANQDQGRFARFLTRIGPTYFPGLHPAPRRHPDGPTWRAEEVMEEQTTDRLFFLMLASLEVFEGGGIPFSILPLPPQAPVVPETVAGHRLRWLTMRDMLPPPLAAANVTPHERERLYDIASLVRVVIEEPNRGVSMPPAADPSPASTYNGPIVRLTMMHDWQEAPVSTPASLPVRIGRILLGGLLATLLRVAPVDDDDHVVQGIQRHGYYYRLWVWASYWTPGQWKPPRSAAIAEFARRANLMLQHLRALQFYPTSVRVVNEGVMTNGFAIPWKLAYDGAFCDLLLQQ